MFLPDQGKAPVGLNMGWTPTAVPGPNQVPINIISKYPKLLELVDMWS